MKITRYTVHAQLLKEIQGLTGNNILKEIQGLTGNNILKEIQGLTGNWDIT